MKDIYTNTNGLSRHEQMLANEQKATKEHKADWQYHFDRKDFEDGEFKVINRNQRPRRFKDSEKAMQFFTEVNGRTTLFFGTNILAHKRDAE